MEANGLAGLLTDDDFVVTIGQSGCEQLIAFTDGDGVDAVGTGTRVGCEGRFLDQALACSQNDEVVVGVFLVLQILDRDVGQNLIIWFNLNQILNCTALRCFGPFWNFEDAHPEAPAVGRENEQPIVVGCSEDVFNEVFITRGGTLGSHSSSALRSVIGQAGTLDVARVADAYDYLFVGDQVLHADVGTAELDVRAALVTKTFFDVQ